MIHRTFAIGLVAAATIGTALIAAPPPPGGNAMRGKTVFTRCAACHKADAGASSGIGPNLAGVVGRRAGTKPGYAYSPAMKASHLIFGDATLSRFLSAPTKVVPGTRMMAAPVANPQDRADVIAFLKTTGGKAR